jgi:hypothetical protein
MAGHGGGGKVYFILYLAVLLELLIIIVERDDAEEELKREKEALARKNKRIQLIAETIINALRGSQTSVSSTSDQTMTLGDPKEPDREFSVKVRVSDPAKDSVNDLSLTILRNESKMDSIEMTNDTSMFPRVQQGQDYIFKYKFKPTFGEGTYKLRFNARTNQIVGVAQSHAAEDTVKIGAVRLTVGELEEVKNGITENVALKGFIDSLLTGNFSNFSTNLGANEFVVNVKRPEAKVTDQLQVIPQIADFTAFPTLGLPNPIKLQGADPKGVKLEKIDGPGEVVQVGDTTWAWQYTPGPNDIGQTYTVHIKGQTNRGGGAKDIGTNSFNVLVKALKPVAGDSGIYVPSDEDEGKPQPYTKFPFKVNGKYEYLDGIYQIKMLVDGKEVKVSNEPTAEYTPVYLEDEGKKLKVEIYYRSVFSRDYALLKSDEFTISAPPMLIAMPGRWSIGDNTMLKIKAGVGLMEAGSDYQSELPGDITVESEPNIFDNKASKSDGINYTLRITHPPSADKVKRDGMPVKVTFRDAKTGVSKTKNFLILPKKR